MNNYLNDQEMIASHLMYIIKFDQIIMIESEKTITKKPKQNMLHDKIIPS